MAKVNVAAATESDPAAIEIQEMLGKARGSIQQLAQRLASEGTGPGVSDVDNWLRAERQLYTVPSCELVEQNGTFRLRATLPGFEARQIRLTALPNAIVISAGGSGKRGSENAEIHFSEFSPNPMLRRIDLPTAIDVESARAKLERGILEVVAAKGGAKASTVRTKARARKSIR